MKSQRDIALAWLIMSFAIALAVFCSVYGRHESEAIRQASLSLDQHHKLAIDSERFLQANQQVLNSNQLALLAIQQSKAR